MDRFTAEKLNAITERFYAAQAKPFSDLRSFPWPGWKRCLQEAGVLGAHGEGALDGSLEPTLFRSVDVPFTVLDVGCGNLRFERYLRALLPGVQMECFAVDNCEALLPDEEALANEFPFVRFQKMDVLGRLVHEADLAAAFEAPPCQLVSCFGLFHHVPGARYRAALLDALVRCAKPGGFVAVSLWQFMDEPGIAAKAQAVHAQALLDEGIDAAWLDEGDYLLGWQNVPGAYRYCHHFTDGEVDGLVASVAGRARLVARFSSDGRTGALNTYVVLQAR